MDLPSVFRSRFAEAIEKVSEFNTIQDVSTYASMVRPAGNPKFGDYQANCAMPIGKQLKLNPRDVAQTILAATNLADLCEPPEIAGPGFMNLRLKDSFLESQMSAMLHDERCLVGQTEQPKKIVIDFSSPNVAKPMHVGHIRSTVIGDCLAKVLAFLGHDVITDNHLGDWGTQFGMIIYGYKHFGDPQVVRQDPVPELAKLYRIVHQLISYHKATANLAVADGEIAKLTAAHETAVAEAASAEGKEAKKKRKAADSIEKKINAAKSSQQSDAKLIREVDADSQMKAWAGQHSDIANAVLLETSKLHAGDQENLALWNEFLPFCKDEINRVYSRLNVEFDHTLGESFYHPMLSAVVQELEKQGLATESDGAICVFLDEFDAPMIVRKRDGAFLYATTDLATLSYRKETFAPDEILYVVDSRQGEHFDKLFAVAAKLGLDKIKLVHVNFGTVLGEDGRPMKTRSGTLVGLESLLDGAAEAAYNVVCNPERLVKLDPPMEVEEQKRVAETIGIGAIKYFDLGHERTSDYKFELEKMVAHKGNTATYAQYSFARTASIVDKLGETMENVVARVEQTGIKFSDPAERALALKLIQFEEALEAVYESYAPNQLVDYLYSTAEAFSQFNERCHVKNAPTTEIQTTRLALVVLTGKVLKKALSLLGIGVVDRM